MSLPSDDQYTRHARNGLPILFVIVLIFIVLSGVTLFMRAARFVTRNPVDAERVTLRTPHIYATRFKPVIFFIGDTGLIEPFIDKILKNLLVLSSHNSTVSFR